MAVFSVTCWGQAAAHTCCRRAGSGEFGSIDPIENAKPAFIYGGRNDRLARFDNQQAAIDVTLEVNGCEKKAVARGDSCSLFNSTLEAPVMTFIHDGGHTFLPEIRSLIVEFFKAHPKTANG